MRAVASVLRSGHLTGGPALDRFERAFANETGALHAVAFSSGTAALHAAYAAVGIGPGDEVITSPITFCATGNAALYLGATPRFADVDAATLLIDPEAAARQIGPRTRAIVPVDYAGQPVSIAPLRALADAHHLALVEDACHAAGAMRGAAPLGGQADISVFSLHPVKHIAAGEGGVATTQDPELARRLRRLRNHGIDRSARDREASGDWAYDMVELGFNYRMDEMSAGLAHSQLDRLRAGIERRAELASLYDEVLAPCPFLRRPVPAAGGTSAWHLYPVRLVGAELSTRRDTVLRALRAEGILANVHYRPVHLLEYYRKHLGTGPGLTPIAEDEAERLISLPLFPAMQEQDVRDVHDALEKVLGHFAGR